MKKYIEFTCNCGIPYKVEVTPVKVPTIGISDTPKNDVYDYLYYCYGCKENKKVTYTEKEVIVENE